MPNVVCTRPRLPQEFMLLANMRVAHIISQAWPMQALLR